MSQRSAAQSTPAARRSHTVVAYSFGNIIARYAGSTRGDAGGRRPTGPNTRRWEDRCDACGKAVARHAHKGYVECRFCKIRKALEHFGRVDPSTVEYKLHQKIWTCSKCAIRQAAPAPAH